ncbi:MAG TPA: tetratricopeptide repeat protein [Catalimonadaceae bacterium]|nr:tetratricopeptide repeat protein [Catalimonadaceae bacterium]HPI12126.1 tetratricopeptide repeat protein [Catalimonadaceae bacterium]
MATAIFFLPKSVVDSNKKLETSSSESLPSTTPEKQDVTHKEDLVATKEISELRKSVQQEKEETKKAQLFEKLANAFLDNHQYDSAGASFEQAATLTSNPKLVFQAGSAYFEGIAFAGTPSRVDYLSGKARDLLANVPSSDGNYTEAQAKTAMTWVNSASPMKGILKLRELADKNPENEYVAYQLGMLSFQSGQHEKAVARYRKVIELNPKNVNAWFYLAQSLLQLGKKDEALKAVNSGLPLAKEDDTKASFEELKKQLTEN